MAMGMAIIRGHMTHGDITLAHHNTLTTLSMIDNRWVCCNPFILTCSETAIPTKVHSPTRPLCSAMSEIR